MFVTRQLRRVCRQLQALGNDVAEERFDESLGGKKEEMRSISKKNMSRYAQCVCMGAIVNQVSHLMASTVICFGHFLAVAVSPKSAGCEDFVHCSSLASIRGPKSVKKTTPLNDFRRCVLVNQREGIKNSKPRCTRIICKRDSIAMTFESNIQHWSGCCVLPQQVGQ